MKKSIIFGAIAGGVAGAILAASVLLGTWMATANTSTEELKSLSDYEIAERYVEKEYGEEYHVMLTDSNDDEMISFVVFDEDYKLTASASLDRSYYGRLMQ